MAYIQTLWAIFFRQAINYSQLTTEFKLEHNYALLYAGRLFDLHNNFDLVNIKYDLTSRQFTLSWVKKDGDWVKDDEADTIELIHKSVSYLRITDKDLDGRLEDDNSLDDLTYYPSTHRDDNESVVDRAEPEPEDDILYNFISGRQIRVCCDAIELALG